MVSLFLSPESSVPLLSSDTVLAVRNTIVLTGVVQTVMTRVSVNLKIKINFALKFSSKEVA